ncbi:MAG: shikimate dehydrogenase [Verrucomicrobia bacterium]|nr:shikimate dehydrogenase [Verrucomicrobiota bacterium]
MQNAALAALGLNWRYLAFDVQPQDLGQAIAGAKAMNFIGLNLTVPHKILAMEMVDELDPAAKTWGSVNTIRFDARAASGDWLPIHQVAPDDISEVRSHGFNTDAEAISQALREDLDYEVRGSRIILLGAGGAGRMAALKLASAGVAHLHLLNRTLERAEAVAAEIRQRYPAVEVVIDYPSERVDLVLNATSLGLKPDDPSPFDESQFPLKRSVTAYDMIYRPAETPFLQAAKAAGCRVANGLSMLLHQGSRAFEIWTGQPAPVEVMREALRKNIYG